MNNQSSNGLILSDTYIYTPATTDVTIRWRKIYGWIPPTENPEYQKKWAKFRHMTATGIEAIGKQ